MYFTKLKIWKSWHLMFKCQHFGIYALPFSINEIDPWAWTGLVYNILIILTGLGYVNAVCGTVRYRIAISEYYNNDLESAEVRAISGALINEVT